MKTLSSFSTLIRTIKETPTPSPFEINDKKSGARQMNLINSHNKANKCHYSYTKDTKVLIFVILMIGSASSPAGMCSDSTGHLQIS